MFATLPLFADIAEKFGRTLINILAVAGSAALGYVLTFVLIWTICRLTIHKQPPATLKKLLSALGAIAAGALAAMLLFDGGGGFGFGGTGWFGTGTSASQNSTEKNNPPTPPAPPKTTPDIDPTQTAAPLRVKVLGGKISSKKFYIVEGETDARELKGEEGVEKVIRDRSEKKPGKLTTRELIIVLKDGDSAGYDSSAVIDLENAAQTAGLSVGYDPKKPK
jgi:hypothetical protein